ncbi:MAG: hypothetical protein HDS65_10075 [Bacteroidales bacterium]|nr:hypothetical protein [Bacteroidales bacterium]
MMNDTDKTFFDWVADHAADAPAALRLKYGRKTEPIDYPAAITQIECRRKFGKKLAETLAAYPQFYFPSVLAGEQSTSDALARFHASYVAEGLPMVDLTSGLGIDALHAASRASKVTAVERDSDKTDALRRNAQGLDVHNLEAVNGDCIEFIDRALAAGEHYTTVFIDPARRAGDGSRVFALADCEPDVTALMPRLASLCDLLIIKASPMLDISHTIEALSPAPVSVMAVGTPTECKELLVIVDFKAEPRETLVEAVTVSGDAATTFAFTREQEKDAPDAPALDAPAEGDYICEPSPALMKSGAFKLLAVRYGLKRFDRNTRVLASDKPVEGFPGQLYKIVKVLPYASRVLKRFAREYPAVNVAVRNFGMSADALRSKLGVRDGGTLRLYGITDARGEKLLLLTEPA